MTSAIGQAKSLPPLLNGKYKQKAEEIKAALKTIQSAPLTIKAEHYDLQALCDRIISISESNLTWKIEIQGETLIVSSSHSSQPKPFVPEKGQLFILDHLFRQSNQKEIEPKGKYNIAINLVYSYIQQAKKMKIDQFLIPLENCDVDHIKYFIDQFFGKDKLTTQIMSLNQPNDSLLIQFKKSSHSTQKNLKYSLVLESFIKEYNCFDRAPLPVIPPGNLIKSYDYGTLYREQLDKFSKMKESKLFCLSYPNQIDQRTINKINVLITRLLLESTNETDKEPKKILQALSSLTKRFNESHEFYKTLKTASDPFKESILNICGLPQKIFQSKLGKFTPSVYSQWSLLPFDKTTWVIPCNSEESVKSALNEYQPKHVEEAYRHFYSALTFGELTINGEAIPFSWNKKVSNEENQEKFLTEFLRKACEKGLQSHITQDHMSSQIKQFISWNWENNTDFKQPLAPEAKKDLFDTYMKDPWLKEIYFKHFDKKKEEFLRNKGVVQLHNQIINIPKFASIYKSIIQKQKELIKYHISDVVIQELHQEVKDEKIEGLPESTIKRFNELSVGLLNISKIRTDIDNVPPLKKRYEDKINQSIDEKIYEDLNQMINTFYEKVICEPKIQTTYYQLIKEMQLNPETEEDLKNQAIEEARKEVMQSNAVKEMPSNLLAKLFKGSTFADQNAAIQLFINKFNKSITVDNINYFTPYKLGQVRGSSTAYHYTIKNPDEYSCIMVRSYYCFPSRLEKDETIFAKVATDTNLGEFTLKNIVEHKNGESTGRLEVSNFKWNKIDAEGITILSEFVATFHNAATELKINIIP